jgi:hypothetical protein
MILNFKTKDLKGRPTGFREKIINGDKIHTIRKNGDRWKPGMMIHFSTGSRTGQYQCFKQGTLISKQRISIIFHPDFTLPFVEIDHRPLMNADVRALIVNDGLTPETFREWWCVPENEADMGSYLFEGWLLHWTNLKY